MAINHLKGVNIYQGVYSDVYGRPTQGVGVYGNASMTSQSNTDLERASKSLSANLLHVFFYAITLTGLFLNDFSISIFHITVRQSNTLRDGNGHHNILQLKLLLQQFVLNIDVTFA